ncbi:MAG: type-F conjugative transfer system secretin TraK [Ottowia sp.]|nr:type-F conjugative transfer system secretin TraK [Ottowia sp.]
MSKQRMNLLLIWLLIVSASRALAEQTISVGDIAQLSATISLREPNILAIQGRKLVELKGWSDELQLQLDQVNGRATFFVATPKQDMRPITLQASDDGGGMYVLHLTAKDIPGEVIVLKPKHRASAKTKERVASTHAYQRAIKNMMLAMAKDDDPQSVVVNKELVLWREARLYLHKKTIDDDMVGERYILTNVTATDMGLAEQEFYRSGVMAVAVGKHTLTPGESTAVYIVRARKDHE